MPLADDQGDERRRHLEHTAGRQSLQRLEAGGVAKALRLVVGDEPRESPVEKQPAERDDERLQAEAGDRARPWNAPSRAPSDDDDRARPTGQARCHSVSMIESSTPRRANAEPTDRSIPPVMMTRPSPRLKMPNAPISRAVFCRLAGDMKRGLSTVTIDAQDEQQQEDRKLFLHR